MLNDLCWPAPIAVIVQEYTHFDMCFRAYEIIRYMEISISANEHEVSHCYDNPITHKRISSHGLINNITPYLIMYMSNRRDGKLHKLMDFNITYYPLPGTFISYTSQIVINSLSEVRNMFATSEIHKIWDTADSIGIKMPDVFRVACLRMYELLGAIIMKTNHEQLYAELFQA